MESPIKFKEWLQFIETGAGAGGVYSPDITICGSWQGAPRGFPEPLSSVGDVKKRRKKRKKK